MIYGIGTDIIEIDRIEKAISKHGQNFISKLFTLNEINYCQSHKFPAQHFAARFAAKEAFIKALGGKIKGMNWKDIEVSFEGESEGEVQKSKRPVFKLYNIALKENNKKGITKMHLSLSHCKSYATAIVFLEI